MPADKIDTLIESERLLIKPAKQSDFGFMHHMHSDLDVMKFIFGRARTETETQEYLNDVFELYEKHRMGQFMVFEKNTMQPVGRCGYAYFYGVMDGDVMAYSWGLDALADNPARVPLIELGYTFARESWGNGYASEAAKALFPYGRDELGLSQIVSLIDQNNKASVAVAERNGLTRKEDCLILGKLSSVYSLPVEQI